MDTPKIITIKTVKIPGRAVRARVLVDFIENLSPDALVQIDVYHAKDQRESDMVTLRAELKPNG